MSLFAPSAPSGLRERIYSARWMSVCAPTLSAAGRVYMGRMTQPGWILDEGLVVTNTGIPQSGTNFWTLRLVTVEGGKVRRHGVLFSTATRSIPADTAVRFSGRSFVGYPLPVDALIAVDVSLSGTPTPLTIPTFQVSLAFGG